MRPQQLPGQVLCWRGVCSHSSMHAEYQLAKKGAYKEKAMEFLKSSWQAAALKSLADRVRPS